MSSILRTPSLGPGCSPAANSDENPTTPPLLCSSSIKYGYTHANTSSSDLSSLGSPTDSLILTPHTSVRRLDIVVDVDDFDSTDASDTEDDFEYGSYDDKSPAIHYNTFEEFEAACKKTYEEGYLKRAAGTIDLASLGLPVIAALPENDDNEWTGEDSDDEVSYAGCGPRTLCASRSASYKSAQTGWNRIYIGSDTHPGRGKAGKAGKRHALQPIDEMDECETFRPMSEVHTTGQTGWRGGIECEYSMDAADCDFSDVDCSSHASIPSPYEGDEDMDPFDLEHPWTDLDNEIQRHSHGEIEVVCQQALLAVPEHEDNRYHIDNEPRQRIVLYRAPLRQSWSSISVHGVVPHIIVNADVVETKYIDTPLETHGDMAALVPAEYARLLGPDHPIASGRQVCLISLTLSASIRTPAITFTACIPESRSKPLSPPRSTRPASDLHLLESGGESEMISMGRDALIWPPESCLFHAPTTPAAYSISPLQSKLADQMTEEAKWRFRLKRDEMMVRHAAKALRVSKLPSIVLAPGWALKRKNVPRAAVSVHEGEVGKGVEWCGTDMRWDGKEGEKERLRRWIQVEGGLKAERREAGVEGM